MKEISDKSEDSRDIRYVSDAIINLYPSHINSLLYPYNHPLISDSLKNAYYCLQKAFRKKRHIHVETADGKVIVDRMELQDDLLTLQSYASWLNNRKIKSLFFSDGLTRKELINFHRIISTKILTEEELSKALSEQNITNIIVHYLTIKVTDNSEKASLKERTRQVLCEDYISTMHYYDDETDQDHASFVADLSIKRSLNEKGQPEPFDGYISNMHDHHVDIDKDQAFFVTDLSEKSFREDKSRYGYVLCEGYIGTMHDMEGTSDAVSALADFPLRLIGGEFSERDEQVRSVEKLCEQEISDDERRIIRSIPPDYMAYILNATFRVNPGKDILMRISAVYFDRNQDEKDEDSFERQKIFFERLTPELRHQFGMLFIYLINSDNRFDNQEPIWVPDTPLSGIAGISGTEGAESVESDHKGSASQEIRRTLENSDFIFDFIVNGKAVLHDIEIDAESAGLFSESQLGNLQKALVLDDISARLSAEDRKTRSSAMLMEWADDMILDLSFDIILELVESDSLESEAFQKILGKLTSMVYTLLERGELEKILELYNSLKTQSLQGNNSTNSIYMIRSIFSTDNFNDKAVEALKQYGRKQREIAFKFMVALRSYLVPYLLDALNEENDPSKRRFMITLLSSVRGDVLPYIISRLRDSRWYVLRNMLYLLRECHGLSSLKEVKDFLDHKVPLVRLEALRTLLSFQDSEADFYVRKFLKSDTFQIQKGAVRLAGAYRIKNAVPHMIRLLKEKDMIGKKFPFKKSIIRMLGRIGDGRAVGQLLNICRSTSMVHKNDLEKLKIEIFKTLHYYHLATIGPILDYGMKSESKDIATLCMKLIKRYKLPAGDA